MPTPEYILSLREKIGHDLLWLPGATAVVLHEGRILLGRRSDNGNWAPITGIVDPGEEPAATAVRECLEEDVRALDVLHATDPQDEEVGGLHPDGTARVAFFADPDGNVLSITQS